MGFDIGAFPGNLFMFYFSHEHRQLLLGNALHSYRTWILDTSVDAWNLFANRFDLLWKHQQYKKEPLYFD